MPTLTEVEVIVADLFRLVEEFDQYCNTNTEKFTDGSGSHEAEFLSHLKPADGVPFDTQAIMVEAVERFRSGLDTQYDISRNLITTGLRTWADFASIPETSPENILSRLYTYFQDNSYTVKTRGMTLATPAAAGSNPANTGILNRLQVDENNHKIESGHTEARVCRCIRDEATGSSKHEEIFEIRGAERPRDRLVAGGSGLVKNIKSISARDSLQYIDNPSFERFSGSAATPTAITSWNIGSTAQLAAMSFNSTKTYRDYPGAPSTDYSLQFTATGSDQGFELNQDLKARNIAVRRDVPIYAQLACMTDSSVSGDSGIVSIQLGGGSSQTVTISTMTINEWKVLRIATGTTAGGGQNNWYDSFKSITTLDLGIDVDSVDVGRNIYIDDVVVAPFTEFDGSWYAMVGGSSKFALDDEFTWSDTATESIIQKWIARLFPGNYLPHTGGTATWPDPT